MNRNITTVWKTIRLGTGLKTVEEFRNAMKKNGTHIRGYANDIFGRCNLIVATQEKEVDLVRPSVEELGFKNGATLDTIYGRAPELGFRLCPMEVGPQLCLQYESKGERYNIAMSAITFWSGGRLGGTEHFIFHCEGESKLSLRVTEGHPGRFHLSHDRFVFIKPRNQERQ